MKHRDDDIITEIFRTEQNNLYRLACYKIGDTEHAADLVQDLFIKVLENPNRDEIKDLKSYLYQSLLNACVSIFRNTQNATTVPIDNNIIDDGCNNDDFMQEYNTITATLQQIPPEQRDVIMLRTIGNKSFAEIAVIVGTPVATVKSRFRYGIEKIRKTLNNNKL